MNKEDRDAVGLVRLRKIDFAVDSLFKGKELPRAEFPNPVLVEAIGQRSGSIALDGEFAPRCLYRVLVVGGKQLQRHCQPPLAPSFQVARHAPKQRRRKPPRELFFIEGFAHHNQGRAQTSLAIAHGQPAQYEFVRGQKAFDLIQAPLKLFVVDRHLHGAGEQTAKAALQTNDAIAGTAGRKALGYGAVIKVASEAKPAIERTGGGFAPLTQEKQIRVDGRGQVAIRRLARYTWLNAASETFGVKEIQLREGEQQITPIVGESLLVHEKQGVGR